MDQQPGSQPPPSISKPKLHRQINGAPKSPPLIGLEIRLLYVRISPCSVDSVPDHLTLRLLRPLETASLALRRDRADKESSEVTYVSTDNIKVTGGLEFEVCEEESLVLCGSLERVECDWNMDCFTAASGGVGFSSAFFQPKLGISSPSVEVYVAGRWSDVPVILTKVVNISPRKKLPRYGTLDAIPEVSNEIDKLTRTEDEYDVEGKLAHDWCPEDVYEGEDGQLSWFNAGVRVGVGIGLGMCLGIGISVGLLMHSYQTTTRKFRSRFF